MYDLDAIEAINFEQLVTATDRLLLLGAKRPRARTSSTVLANGPRHELAGKTLRIRARVPGRRWATVKHPLIIALLLVLIGSVVWAAALIAGAAAASAVALSGLLGGAISGVFAHKEVRRARA